MKRYLNDLFPDKFELLRLSAAYFYLISTGFVFEIFLFYLHLSYNIDIGNTNEFNQKIQKIRSLIIQLEEFKGFKIDQR